MNFYTDNDDLRFYFERAIPWATLARAASRGRESEFATVEEAASFYREVASTFGELAGDVFHSRAVKFDREDAHVEKGEVKDGASMLEAFAAMKSADVYRMCFPRELGGLDVPLIVYFLAGEMIARADVSAMTHYSFHGGIGLAMLAYSIQEGTTEFKDGIITKTRFLSQMNECAAGDAWGSMDITEPNAGSDMAALRTRAEVDADGTWRIYGQKIFITSGHGKYHFVVARTEAQKPTDASDAHEHGGEGDAFAGLAGLSMFLVQAYEDLPDGQRKRFVTVERVEEKLGHHGSVTAALQFDGAKGELIGKRGEGFRYMLTLMNNARIGVGFESIGLAEAALRMARAYAEERRSMGKVIARHEMIADYLDEMELDVIALRALAVTSEIHEELAQKLALTEKFQQNIDETTRARSAKEAERHRREARRLTPLLKYAATEKALEIARRNMQIHGGVGYTREYGAEKLMRDALVLPVYEGTSQIQSLMAMKDTLAAIMKRPQEFARRIATAALTQVSAKDPLERRVAKLRSLSLSAQRHLVTRTAKDKLKTLSDIPFASWASMFTKEWDPKRDFAVAMLHAERLTKILADEAIAEILLDQSKEHPERRELLERFLERAEIRARALHEEITTTGDRLLASIAKKEAQSKPSPSLAAE